MVHSKTAAFFMDTLNNYPKSEAPYAVGLIS